MKHTRVTVTAALAGYVAAIVLANWLTSRFGLVPVLPGLLVTAGTYAAGAAFGLRDLVQQAGGRRLVLAAIAVGAALSWVLSTPALAVASAAAFSAAEVADMAVYTPLRERGWRRAVLASNTVGAVVDTFLFLSLAGFPLTVASVGGQLVGKVLWATIVPLLLISAAGGAWRAVPREPVHQAGA